MSHILYAKGILDSIDKIANFHEIAPNFTYKNDIFKVSLEKDRPTSSILQILWKGHVRNLLFFFFSFLPVVSS